MKKTIVRTIALSVTFMLMFTASGCINVNPPVPQPTAAPTQQTAEKETPNPTAAPTENPTSAPTDEPSDVPETDSPITQGNLVFQPPEIYGMEKQPSGDYPEPEEIYYYDTYEISGRNIMLDNMAVTASLEENEQLDEMVTRLIYEYVGEDIMDIELTDGTYGSYPCFSVSWLSAGDEDAYRSQGTVVLTDIFVYIAYFSLPETAYAENEADIASWLDGFTLVCKNTLMLKGAEIENARTVITGDRPDGTYFYWISTEDFDIISESAAAVINDGETPEAFVARVVESTASNGSRDMTVENVNGFIDSLNYPCFRFTYYWGEDIHARRITGLAVTTDDYVYLYYFECYDHFYDELSADIEAYIGQAAMVELQ